MLQQSLCNGKRWKPVKKEQVKEHKKLNWQPKIEYPREYDETR